MKNKQKVVFIDVDGTLTNPHGRSSWEIAHEHFAREKPEIIDKMNENYELFKAGKFDYEEWARLDVAMWLDKDIKELEKALLPPNLIDGARDGIQLLQDNGFIVILVSGGIHIMVDKVKELVGADQAYSVRVLDTDGKINGKIDAQVADSKADTVLRVAHEFNYDLQCSYAIGDNFNDIEMFELVSYSVAINSSREDLIKVADVSIKTDSFMEASKLVLEHARSICSK